MSCQNERCCFQQKCRLNVDTFVDPWEEPCLEFDHWMELSQDAATLRDSLQDEDEIPFTDDEDFTEEELSDGEAF